MSPYPEISIAQLLTQASTAKPAVAPAPPRPATPSELQQLFQRLSQPMPERRAA